MLHPLRISVYSPEWFSSGSYSICEYNRWNCLGAVQLKQNKWRKTKHLELRTQPNLGSSLGVVTMIKILSSISTSQLGPITLKLSG